MATKASAPDKFRTSDDVVRFIRESREKLIKQCAEKAAAKIIAELPTAIARQFNQDVLAELIRREFAPLKN